MRFQKTETKKRYGNLLWLGKEEKRGPNQAYIFCRCLLCGKEFWVRKTLLATGKQTSCGCDSNKGPVKSNEYKDIAPGVVGIILNHGKMALIDAEDRDKCAAQYWAMYGRYVKSNTVGPLHKYLLPPAPKGVVLDHINGDTLDNRKSNLRLATYRQNAQNRKKRSDNRSGHTGVSIRHGKFIAFIKSGQDSRQKTFKTYEEAVEQREAWEDELMGEYNRRRAAELVAEAE